MGIHGAKDLKSRQTTTGRVADVSIPSSHLCHVTIIHHANKKTQRINRINLLSHSELGRWLQNTISGPAEITHKLVSTTEFSYITQYSAEQ